MITLDDIESSGIIDVLRVISVDDSQWPEKPLAQARNILATWIKELARLKLEGLDKGIGIVRAGTGDLSEGGYEADASEAGVVVEDDIMDSDSELEEDEIKAIWIADMAGDENEGAITSMKPLRFGHNGCEVGS